MSQRGRVALPKRVDRQYTRNHQEYIFDRITPLRFRREHPDNWTPIVSLGSRVTILYRPRSINQMFTYALYYYYYSRKLWTSIMSGYYYLRRNHARHHGSRLCLGVPSQLREEPSQLLHYHRHVVVTRTAKQVSRHVTQISFDDNLEFSSVADAVVRCLLQHLTEANMAYSVRMHHTT